MSTKEDKYPNLTAAAPDLLEACQTLLKFLRLKMGATFMENDRPGIVCLTRNAIAKAKKQPKGM